MKRLTSILAAIMIVILSLIPMIDACADNNDDTRFYIVTENGLTVILKCI